MCTLTYFPKGKNQFILTSNRDEAPNRPTLPLSEYHHQGHSFLYPKDGIAGGTWLAAGSNKRIVSLLNGGFKAHLPSGPYRISRGVVVLEALTTDTLDVVLETFDLQGVEPFTMVIIDWSNEVRVIELIWDGDKRHIREYENEPRIWSSSLLYSADMKKERELWFADFKSQIDNPDEDAISNFHRNTASENNEYGLIMDRGFVKTKSVSQISVKENLSFAYEELGKSEIRKELRLS